MIYARKNKRDGVTYYFVRYELKDGRRKKEKVPPVLDATGRVARHATKQDARDLETLRKAEVLNGTWRDPDAPPVSPPELDRGLTFAQLADKFLEGHPGRRRSNHYPVNVAELVKDLGDRRIRELTRSELDAYRVRLATTKREGQPIPKRQRLPGGPTRYERPPLSSTTVLKRLRVLHRMLKVAVRWGLLEFNPAADLEKPAANRGRTRYLTREEFDRLEAGSPPWIRPMLRLAVATGMRLKEVATLKWEGVDLKGGVLFVDEETKTGTRPVPLSKAARAVLEAQRDRRREVGREAGRLSPYVFTADDGADYSDDVARRRISELTRASAAIAKLGGGVGFHVLRHTAAAWMVQDGVPLYEVQKVLGHSSPMLTQRYAHLQPGHLRRAMEALDRQLSDDDATSLDSQGPNSVPPSEAEAR